jgi:3-oxoacyl-[acyl-carrier protein] reductase
MKLFLTIILIFSFVSNISADYSGKRILVTASTGALGEAISYSLAAEGYNMIIAGRNDERLEALKKRLEAKNRKITVDTAIIDFSNHKTIEESAKKFSKTQINGIVLITPRSILTKDDIPSSQEWSKAFAETFIEPLEVVRLFSPKLSNNSSIVVISGASSKNYLPNYPNTNVIKLAWVGEIKNLMHFFAPQKIRANVVSPGVILTQHHRDNIKKKATMNNITFDEQIARDTSSIPMKSYGTTDDVSSLVLFLLSNKAGHLNGTNILLDGGESNNY